MSSLRRTHDRHLALVRHVQAREEAEEGALSEPLGPMMLTNSPSDASKSMFCNTSSGMLPFARRNS